MDVRVEGGRKGILSFTLVLSHHAAYCLVSATSSVLEFQWIRWSRSEGGLDKNPEYHLFLLLLQVEDLGQAVTPKPGMQPLLSTGCSCLHSDSSLSCSP